MLTWILGYLLIGFFIYWLCTAIFGIDYDLPLFLQVVAIGLWPIVVTIAGFRTLAAQPVDEIAMEAAQHRNDAPPTHRNSTINQKHTPRFQVVHKH